MTENILPRFTIADVLRLGFDRYIHRYGPQQPEIYRIVHALMACRTEDAGSHQNICPHCGYTDIAYNSCRNRHCPCCQARKAKQWIEARSGELLPVPYFHLVFTVPHELNRMALQNKKAFYTILFRAVSETLIQLGFDKNRLGCQVGFFTILHTWTQTLMDHVHLHVVIPGGGLTPDKKEFKKSRPDFIFPVRVMSVLFRGKLLAFLKESIADNKIQFHGSLNDLKNPPRLQTLFDTLYNKDFVVYAKPTFASPKQVVEYLSRYTHRVAISDRRILELTEDTITFTWRDRADNNTVKKMCLDIVEFIRRFLMHLLPHGFVKIRYFGFMANPVRKKTIKLCWKLLAAKIDQLIKGVSLNKLTSSARRLCPLCNKAPMIFDRLLPLSTTG